MRVTLIILPFIVCGVAGQLQEPHCTSMYDYEHKLLYKLIKIEEDVKHFRQFIDDLKSDQTRREGEQKQLLDATLAKFEAQHEQVAEEQHTTFTDALEKFETGAKTAIDEAKTESGQLFTEFKSLMRNLTATTDRLKSVRAVGFSVKGPIKHLSSREITFNSVITNDGDVFDVDTGKFVCKTPGFYFFSLSILKVYSHRGYAQCAIRKNNAILVYAYAEPSRSGQPQEYDAATKGVYLHLDAGDEVTLGSCSTAGSLHSYTSFTGFMVMADVV